MHKRKNILQLQNTLKKSGTSQIKIERIFSIVANFISFCKCRLQIDNHEEEKFVNKNWLTILPIGCLKHVDLVIRCEVESNLIMNWRLNLKMVWNVRSPSKLVI